MAKFLQTKETLTFSAKFPNGSYKLRIASEILNEKIRPMTLGSDGKPVMGEYSNEFVFESYKVLDETNNILEYFDIHRGKITDKATVVALTDGLTETGKLFLKELNTTWSDLQKAVNLVTRLKTKQK